MLRKATAADVPALCEARKQQPIDEGLAPVASIDRELDAYFKRTLADETLVEWVFEEGGAIVATAGLALMPFPPAYADPIGTRGYITDMHTAPSHRGRGIASRLMAKLLDEARERGIHRLLLSASEMGKPVYRKCGFVDNDSWMELEL